MDRVLYISASGADQTMLAQSINANNLANVSTTAFKEDLTAFQSKQVYGAGHPSRVYAGTEKNGVNTSSGMIKNTGRELDVAVSGNGWIAVQAADGGEKYTRAGSLHITPTGQLKTANGLAVLGNSGVGISMPPAEKIEIGDDGTISIKPVGQTPASLVTVDRIKLVNPPQNELVKSVDGLMELSQGGAAQLDASVSLISGALEGSNVNAVEAMVNMIALARQFEADIKVMKTVQQMDAASAQLMRIG